uniref:Uncharacterized protein n=1 Tax=Timema cristinae TaxID=61476 RepID=A0A7R9DBS6_TIMCR|nr:unnamed protein product [Timema cristinae]
MDVQKTSVKITSYQDELGLRATQYRAIQRRLLTKFKDKTPSPISHLGTLLATTHGLILETADQFEQSMQGLQQASCQLTCTCQLIILLLKMMDTASSEDFSDLEAALSSSVHDFHEQGWEDVTDAALCFLLRTSLAKSHKEKQRVTNSTVEAMKDTTKLKKHVSSAIDRLSKSTNILERKAGTDDFSNVSHSSHPPKTVSPIPEGLEVPTADSGNDTEITLPVSSRFTERKASGTSRGRSALLHDRKAKMLASNILDPDKINTEKMGVVSSQVETEQLTSAECEVVRTLAGIKGVIESPPDIFPPIEDEDW